MYRKINFHVNLSAALILLLGAELFAQSSEFFRAMNQPFEPFHIIGNIYYVGASDVTSFLITTDEGHILLDGGFSETVPMIRENIETLGFKLSDIKILLNSHAHGDHAGGLAELKKLSGATLYVMNGDVPLIESGARIEPDGLYFPPVKADVVISAGDTIELAGQKLVANLTPAHTRGCTSWSMQVAENGEVYDVVFVGSPNVLESHQLVNNLEYPEIAEDFQHGFDVLRSLACDIFLGAHGSYFSLQRKAQARREGIKANPFIDPDGYRMFVDRKEEAFRKRLEKERLTSAPGRRNSGG